MSINETGMDEEEVDRQISKDNERADRLGLILDSDPRKTTPKGNLLAGGEEKDKQGPESEEGRKETTE
jgi:capsid protein